MATKRTQIIVFAIVIPLFGVAMFCGTGLLILHSLAGKMDKDPVKLAERVASSEAEYLVKVAEDKKRKKRAAWVRAENYVTKVLKSPSTANFGSIFGEYQDPDTQVVDNGDNQYRIEGWVDSQNGFGATVRTNFAILLHDDGTDDWQLLEGPVMAPR